MAISWTKGHGWRAIPTQYRKASDILTSTLNNHNTLFLPFWPSQPESMKVNVLANKAVIDIKLRSSAAPW